MNPVWTIGLGWTLAELQAKPFLDFVHPDDRATTLAEVGRLAEGAETLRFENRYRHRDGSYRWLRWSARSVPVRQEIYATARDVTQRKRLEREVLEVVDREKEPPEMLAVAERAAPPSPDFLAALRAGWVFFIAAGSALAAFSLQGARGGCGAELGIRRLVPRAR